MENSVMKEEIVIVASGVAGLATALALQRVGVTQETNFHKQGEEGMALGPRAVHRKALLEALIEQLPIDTVRFSSKLRSIEKTKTRQDNDSFGVIALIGCDGVHSVVSKWLGLKDPVHSGRCAVRGLGVFPEGHGLKHEAQQFVDRGLRFGIAPINYEDEEMAKGDPRVIQKTILENVTGSPQVVKDVIQQSEMQSLPWAPLLFRYPWDVIFGRLSDGTITVAGDAMHPMTPDLGQGGCASLEDAVILGRHIGNSYIKNGGMISQEDLEVEIQMYVKRGDGELLV
ncbi:monooxygenase 2-like [Papaver somniferum]|uniref:monooxygenase 2-like n=1 Tax=Papaver somniferum TaxID=3469 RepID=UPI000E6FB16C|nr:monooxygenase 2-like [Papaver somniferum]